MSLEKFAIDCLSVYISGFGAQIVSHTVKDSQLIKSVVYSVVYIITFAIITHESILSLFPPQKFSADMIILPLLAICMSGGKIVINKDIIRSLIVESITAAAVEEALFRRIIPSYFSNSVIAVIVSGLLFSAVHVKSLNVPLVGLAKLIISCMLFNILMFQSKPNNILFHFMWNFITMSIFTTQDYIEGSSITTLETSNSTIALFICYILIKSFRN